MTVNLKRYALWFIGVTFALMALILALDAFFGVDFPNGAASIIPAMAAAMVEGQKHADATRDPIPRPWKQAGFMTLVGMLISIVLAVPVFFVEPRILSVVADYAVWLVGLFALFALMQLVVNRFFLTMGAKNQWKAMDAKAGQ